MQKTPDQIHEEIQKIIDRVQDVEIILNSASEQVHTLIKALGEIGNIRQTLSLALTDLQVQFYTGKGSGALPGSPAAALQNLVDAVTEAEEFANKLEPLSMEAPPQPLDFDSVPKTPPAIDRFYGASAEIWKYLPARLTPLGKGNVMLSGPRRLDVFKELILDANTSMTWPKGIYGYGGNFVQLWIPIGDMRVFYPNILDLESAPTLLIRNMEKTISFIDPRTLNESELHEICNRIEVELKAHLE